MSCHCDDDEMTYEDWISGDDEYDRQERWTCLFGADCCMPGEHMASECHTAEMYEQEMAQYEQTPGSRAVQLLDKAAPIDGD